MSARRPLLVLLLLTGCELVDPVIGSSGGGIGELTCTEVAECALLERLPEVVEETDVELPVPSCAQGMSTRVLEIDADTTLEAADLVCVSLHVDVLAGQDEGEDEGDPLGQDEPPLVTLHVRGGHLASTSLSVRTTARAVALVIDASRIDDTELLADGPVALSLRDVYVHRTRLALHAPAIIAPPRVLVERGMLDQVSVELPQGELRLHGTDTDHVVVDAAALVVETGFVNHAIVRAGVVDALGADVVRSRIEARHFVAAGGYFQAVHVAECGSVMLHTVSVRSSLFAACEQPLRLEESGVYYSAFTGDLIASSSRIVRSALGGSRVDSDSEIVGSALCGVEHLTALSAACVRCEPDAPPDVCADVSGDLDLCPGLCASTCERFDRPTLEPERCMR